MTDWFVDDLDMDAGSLFECDSVGLLVVDVQEKLYPSIAEKEQVQKRVIQAIEVAGYLERPIIVTEQYVKGLGSTLPEVKSTLERFGAYNPIEKIAFSCFGEPTFADALNESGIETLVVVGIETHICVMQTVLQSLDFGLSTFLIAEATGSRNPLHKEEAVVRMRDEGSLIGSVEMFAFEAMRDAKHPAFKKVQKVIL